MKTIIFILIVLCFFSFGTNGRKTIENYLTRQGSGLGFTGLVEHNMTESPLRLLGEEFPLAVSLRDVLFEFLSHRLAPKQTLRLVSFGAAASSSCELIYMFHDGIPLAWSMHTTQTTSRSPLYSVASTPCAMSICSGFTTMSYRATRSTPSRSIKMSTVISS